MKICAVLESKSSKLETNPSFANRNLALYSAIYGAASLYKEESPRYEARVWLKIAAVKLPPTESR